MRNKIKNLCNYYLFVVNRLSTWYEDLEEYEGNLEAMASAHLDQVNNQKKEKKKYPEKKKEKCCITKIKNKKSFQDELQHVNQWFGYLTDAEKTATLYTLLQHSSQVQIRFFIHLLQEMRKPKPILRGNFFFFFYMYIFPSLSSPFFT